MTEIKNFISVLEPYLRKHDLSLENTEFIQALWANCGSIKKLTLSNKSGEKTSVVVKFVEMPNKQSVSNIRKSKSYDNETLFYEKYACQVGDCKVPELKFSSKNQENNLILVLEDLDAKGYSTRLEYGSLDIFQAKLCIEWLAEFHLTFLNKKTDLWPEGTYWYLATRQDELTTMDKKNPLFKNAKKLDEKLKTSKYKTVIHGDAKVANFCFGDNKVAAVDFQYTGHGVGVRDLVYFLGSIYDDAGLKRHSDDLIDYYFSFFDTEVRLDWEPLIPICYADFERFLLGWNPKHYKLTRYSSKMVQKALSAIN